LVGIYQIQRIQLNIYSLPYFRKSPLWEIYDFLQIKSVVRLTQFLFLARKPINDFSVRANRFSGSCLLARIYAAGDFVSWFPSSADRFYFSFYFFPLADFDNSQENSISPAPILLASSRILFLNAAFDNFFSQSSNQFYQTFG
jgi:hypothetical protein